MATIKLTCGRGGENLSEMDKDIINKISEEYSAKIERYLKDVTSSEVHLKCFEKDGNVKRYTINIRINSPNHKFDSHAEDYILNDAVHNAFKKILAEIEHKIKKEN